MWVTLHALALLACPIVTLIVILLTKRRSFAERSVVAPLLIPLAIGFMPMTMKHMCDEGQAFGSWLIPLLCLWPALLLIGPTVVRRAVATLLGVAMFVLTYQHDTWVHTDEITGSKQWAKISRAAMNRAELGEVAIWLANRGLRDTNSYAAGWLREIDFGEQRLPPREWQPVDGDARPLWHSWFTQLYERVTIPLDYWYPGGTPAAAASGVELRPRAPIPAPLRRQTE